MQMERLCRLANNGLPLIGGRFALARSIHVSGTFFFVLSQIQNSFRSVFGDDDRSIPTVASVSQLVDRYRTMPPKEARRDLFLFVCNYLTRFCLQCVSLLCIACRVIRLSKQKVQTIHLFCASLLTNSWTISKGLLTSPFLIPARMMKRRTKRNRSRRQEQQVQQGA